jgi:hypothetical protein
VELNAYDDDDDDLALPSGLTGSDDESDDDLRFSDDDSMSASEALRKGTPKAGSKRGVPSSKKEKKQPKRASTLPCAPQLAVVLDALPFNLLRVPTLRRTSPRGHRVRGGRGIACHGAVSEMVHAVSQSAHGT